MHRPGGVHQWILFGCPQLSHPLFRDLIDRRGRSYSPCEPNRTELFRDVQSELLASQHCTEVLSARKTSKEGEARRML